MTAFARLDDAKQNLEMCYRRKSGGTKWPSYLAGAEPGLGGALNPIFLVFERGLPISLVSARLLPENVFRVICD